MINTIWMARMLERKRRYGFWFQPTPLKHMSQLGWFSRKIKFMFQSTHQWFHGISSGFNEDPKWDLLGIKWESDVPFFWSHFVLSCPTHLGMIWKRYAYMQINMKCSAIHWKWNTSYTSLGLLKLAALNINLILGGKKYSHPGADRMWEPQAYPNKVEPVWKVPMITNRCGQGTGIDGMRPMEIICVSVGVGICSYV